MRTLCILILWFSALPSLGQGLERQVIGAAGMDEASAQAQLGFTLGEAVIQGGTSATSILTQGFQQVDTNSYASVPPLTFGAPQMSVYPNPASSALTLRITGLQERGHVQVRTRIMDMSGKLVWSGQLPSIGGEIAVDQLAASTYVILIASDRGALLHRIRFVKY